MGSCKQDERTDLSVSRSLLLQTECSLALAHEESAVNQRKPTFSGSFIEERKRFFSLPDLFFAWLPAQKCGIRQIVFNNNLRRPTKVGGCGSGFIIYWPISALTKYLSHRALVDLSVCLSVCLSACLPARERFANVFATRSGKNYGKEL